MYRKIMEDRQWLFFPVSTSIPRQKEKNTAELFLQSNIYICVEVFLLAEVHIILSCELFFLMSK